MSKRDYFDVRLVHPAEQRTVRDFLLGEVTRETATPEQLRVADQLANELAEKLRNRRRMRRLPAERTERKAQKKLFKAPKPSLCRVIRKK